MIYIDKYAYISGFRQFNPTLKILFSISFLIACVCVNNTVFHLCVFIFMLALLTSKGKIPLTYYLKLILIPAGFLVLSTVSIIVEISKIAPTAYYFKVGTLYLFITESGVLRAFSLIFKSLSSVSCLYFLILTTPMTEIIWFLYKLKVPVVLVEQFTLVYRFIFLLMEKVLTKRNSQRCRFGYATYGKGLKSFGMLFASVFVEAYDKANRIYDSMLTRGYDGTMKYMTGDNAGSQKKAVTEEQNASS